MRNRCNLLAFTVHMTFIRWTDAQRERPHLDSSVSSGLFLLFKCILMLFYFTIRSYIQVYSESFPEQYTYNSTQDTRVRIGVLRIFLKVVKDQKETKANIDVTGNSFFYGDV